MTAWTAIVGLLACAGWLTAMREWERRTDAERSRDFWRGLHNDADQHATRMFEAAMARKAQAEVAEKIVAGLRREITNAQRNNAERNRELDALHYVWCDGGCATGVHRFCGAPEEITEEVVQLAERNTKRLRAWYVNRQHRLARGT